MLRCEPIGNSCIGVTNLLVDGSDLSVGSDCSEPFAALFFFQDEVMMNGAWYMCLQSYENFAKMRNFAVLNTD